MSGSLIEFGNYRDDILVFTDQSGASHIANFDPNVKRHVHAVALKEINHASRFLVAEHIGSVDFPVLYVDADIIVGRDIYPTLRAIGAENRVFISSERIVYPALVGQRAWDIDNFLGKWFGLDLYKSDLALQDATLLCGNSGLFGFSDKRAFLELGRTIYRYYTDPIHSTLAWHFTDQPFFNYVIAKHDMVDADLLTYSCKFAQHAETASVDPALFTHFVWARDDKAAEMADSVGRLRQARLIEVQSTGMTAR